MAPKPTKRGACSFTVTGRKAGATFYDEPMKFPVSWRGRDAATSAVQRKIYSHAVLALSCTTRQASSVPMRSKKPGVVTLASCEKGVCSLLRGSTKRSEQKHRGKAAYNRTIAGIW
jgi:hypothetical protein